jgi:hypothetical protein
MGPLADAASTRDALAVAVPMLKEMLTQPPLPGRAFHPPSHAALILVPLYGRWTEGHESEIVREYLGDRDTFGKLLADQLVAARRSSTPIEDFEKSFYAYTGRYLANALARFDARSAVPALKTSLEAYRAWGGQAATVAYTERALVALGDADARSGFEAQLADPAQRDAALATLVWLCRNGQGETLRYASTLLGTALEVDATQALDTWFLRQFEE